MSRTEITNNSLGAIPTLPIFVGFNNTPFPSAAIPLFKVKMFAGLNAYYQKISYGQLSLTPEQEMNVSLTGSPSNYTWGFFDINMHNIKAFTLDVFGKVLVANPQVQVQDRIIILVLDAFTAEIQGRGAMGLIPGVTPYPTSTPPQNQELFVGPLPRDGPMFTKIRAAFFITQDDEDDYPFSTYYNGIRRPFFEDGTDQFVRGLSIFCKDSALSCAVHDVLHGIKRLASGLPTTSLPGSRARAVPCLYNLQLQNYWMNNGDVDRSVYCTPYVGWWDNIGDHLHPNVPRAFFSGTPYGVSSFTKTKMEFIPPSYVGTATGTQSSFQLVPLAVTTLPQQTGGQPVLVVRVPLSQDEKEYLLVEYRRFAADTVDGVTVNYDEIFGDPADDPECVNPPEQLVSDSGILVYRVDENAAQYGGDPGNVDITGNPLWIQRFILYLYTPSMMTITGALNWSQRSKVELKSATFKPDVHPVFRLAYPSGLSPTMRVQIQVTRMDDNSADITVTKTSL